MALLRNPTDQSGVTLRNPAQREKGRVDPGVREQFEDRIDIAFDPGGNVRPVRASDRCLKRADLKPVLNINRKAIDYRV